MIGPTLKPLARIALTFALVWFYHALTAPHLDGVAQVVVVVGLAIPTWLVVSRVLFPTGGDGRFPF